MTRMGYRRRSPVERLSKAGTGAPVRLDFALPIHRAPRVHPDAQRTLIDPSCSPGIDFRADEEDDVMSVPVLHHWRGARLLKAGVWPGRDSKSWLRVRDRQVSIPSYVGVA